MAHWHSCNILHVADDAHRLWQFEVKGGSFVLNREHGGRTGESLPSGAVDKSWRSLWQPRLNVAWLPVENVFLRVVELPRSNFDETLAMVELQLEKLSPIPVTQIVWMIHILPRYSELLQQSKLAGEAKEDATTDVEAGPEDLQTVIVVIAERRIVEEFLGRLETRGFLGDRLEAPMLDQLEATPVPVDGAWIYPVAPGNNDAALVAWWSGGGLRNLGLVILPPGSDRAKNLKDQLAQLTWAGELEGWLTTPPQWHLVADPAAAGEWENMLRDGLGEPVKVVPPLPHAELAARTAQRATSADPRATLLPAEFTARYRDQFFDRLWLRGLMAVGILYAIGVAIYFCATGVLRYQTHRWEQKVADIGSSYTNAMRIKAKYNVLKERQELKFAALDCWKILAEQMPPILTLQRFSFVDGQKLSLSGTAPANQINTLLEFNKAMKKAKLGGKPMFDPSRGEDVTPRIVGDKASWNLSLELLHTEDLR